MTSVQAGLALAADQFDRIGPVTAAWLRLVWAGLILLVLARPRRSDFTRAGLRACLLLGAVTAGMMTLFMLAIARIPLGTASALEFLGPLAVSLYAGRHAGLLRWSALAAGGVLLLTEPWQGGTDPAGLALALGAGACWAGYIVLTQRAGDQVEGLKGLAVSLPTAAVVTTVLVGPAAIGAVTPSLAFTGLLLALLAPLVPFILELLALRRLTTAAFGTLLSLEPAIALAIGAAVLGQVPGPVGILGVVCVVTAGMAVVRGGERAP
ncbi:EamA family transporter, partial [Kitasatospora sp. NPDC047058]|uniref:EamA family transporter n=1 Tax=Kitasatospora sp. NPDC047058 TaxID=3155620 RepID=UPI0034096CB3